VAKEIRVGTRESKLARLQTDIVVDKLKAEFPGGEFVICPVSTHGDKVLNKPLFELGGRGVFVKELEEALYANEVDLVVHSLKDMPTDMPKGLALSAVLDRDDPRDVLVSRDKLSFAKLPPNSKVATSSRRRSAQLRSLRNDLEFVDIRGNLQTRLRKLEEGQCDAIVLAAAGLLRLGLKDQIVEFFDIVQSTPAAGQAALAVECREDDRDIVSMLERIDNKRVRQEITAERSFLDRLGGGCSVPIGALARYDLDNNLELIGCVASIEGDKIIRSQSQTKINNDSLTSATNLGIKLADEMIRAGARDLLQSFPTPPPDAVLPPWAP
jgi:hydroxymethylbilane synthase